MSLTLRKMTPNEITAVLRDADQPPLSMKPERTAHGKIQKKDLVLVAAVTKATRPLNSWIAYRSYYSRIFISFQQKEISGFLTILWQTDPFKGKWTVLAKSYSMIRDSQGKANAPLEKFLAINGPLIGVIEPAQYLQALSWEVAVDEEGQTVMRRNGTLMGEQLTDTNVSVNDVIRNSYEKGYFTGDLSKVILAGNECVAMVNSVQPTSNAQYSTKGHLEGHDTDFAAAVNIEGSSNDKEQISTKTVIDDKERDPKIGSIADEAGVEGSMAGDNNDVPGKSNAVAVIGTSAVMTATVASTTFDPFNLSPGSHLKIDVDMTEIQSHNMASANDPDISSLSASAFNLDGEYPFNTEFDPDFSGDTFNPFMGNQFNVFDMSEAPWDDFIDFDACA